MGKKEDENELRGREGDVEERKECRGRKKNEKRAGRKEIEKVRIIFKK